MIVRYALPILAGAALFSPAMAASEYNKAIAHVGSQGGNLGYVTFVISPTGSCVYNTLYIDLTSDSGKAEYAVALTAAAQGRPLSRIDYTNNAGTCTVTLVEM